MSDLIDRQAAIDVLDTGLWGVEWDKALATAMLKDLPSVQPEKICVATVTLSDEQIREAVDRAKNEVISVLQPERKKGKWKPFDLTWGRSIFSCSCCGDGIEVPTECGMPIYRFCPNCGADMRQEGERDETDRC